MPSHSQNDAAPAPPTPSLFDLPPEIVIQIIRSLDWSFFADDVRRLTVSRKWYSIAQPAFLSRIHLSNQSLSRLAAGPRARAQLNAISANTVAVEIVLEYRTRDTWQRLYSGPPPWVVQLNQQLNRLVEALHTPKLRSLRLLGKNGEFSRNPNSVWPTRMFLDDATVCNVLTLSNLTSLHLDVWGSSWLQRTWVQARNVCLSIAASLATLRSLRLRYQVLCPVAFEPPGSGSIALEELIVVITAPFGTNGVEVGFHCAHTSTALSMSGMDAARLYHLRNGLKEAMLALCERMPEKRKVRLLSHSMRTRERKLFSWDALTRETRVLGPDQDWAEDGLGEGTEERDASNEPEDEIPVDDTPGLWA